MKKLKRATLFVIKSLVVLIALGFLITGILSYKYGREIEGRLNRIKAAGQPVSLADLASVKVPESQNAAPLYKELFRVIRTPACVKVSSSAASHEPGSAEWDQAVLALRKTVIPLIKAAAVKPICRFPDAKTRLDRKSADEDFGRLAGLRHSARILGMEAAYSAKRRDWTRAVDSSLLSLKVIDQQQYPVFMLEDMVLSAMKSLTLHYLSMALESGGIDNKNLDRLDKALASLEWRDDFRRAMINERAFRLSMLDHSDLPTAWRKSEQLATLKDIDEILRLADQPMPRLLTIVRSDSADDNRKWPPLSSMILPMWKRSFSAHLRLEIQTNCCRAYLAAVNYRNDTGAYPASLAAVESRYNRRLPNDPVTGGPLHYRLVKGKPIVYSVGADLKDNGGKLDQMGWDPNASGDIVWPIPARESR